MKVIRTTLFLIVMGISILFNCSCGDILNGLSSPTSEIIHYRGTIVVNGDSIVNTNTAIYAANLNDKVNAPGDRPLHPLENGSFELEVTTYSHSPGVSVEQWQCGPLRILIEYSAYETYNDSLTNNQLKQLKQNSAGEWVLPTLTLYKKN